MITNDSIQLVRDRVDIIDIVGHFVQIKKRGSNFIGNCPFHNEKTPSFNVNPARGIYKCFGCGEAGDAIQFVQSHEKFSFIEAIKWIADFYHIEIEESESNPDFAIHRHKEESLRIIFDFAAQYFHESLLHSESGKIIGLSYFKERGFSEDTIDEFQLGYADESWQNFYDAAIKKGFNKELLIESGLVTEKNDKIYDTYRGRVIFPIMSNTGKVVGLGGRILNTQVKAPKYINSHESPIYNKSKILYGLYQARNEIKNLDECILVEGYTDVISLFQRGIKNVVASSGTALTEGQLKLIKNISKNLVIIYDGDAAGIKAAVRGMQLALKENMNISIVLLPENEDPDSYIKKYNQAAFRKYILENKKDIIDFQIDVSNWNKSHQDAQLLTQLLHELAETIAQIDVVNNFILKNLYVKKVSERLKVNEQEFLQLMNKYTVDKIKKDQQHIASQNQFSEFDYIDQSEVISNSPSSPLHVEQNKELGKYYQSIIEILLKYGDKPYKNGLKVYEYFFETFSLEEITMHPYAAILNQLLQYFSENKTLDAITLKMIRHEDISIRNACIELLLESQQPHPIWDAHKNDNPYLDKSNELNEEYITICDSVFSYYEFYLLSQMIESVLVRIKEPNVDFSDQLVYLKVLEELKEKQRTLGSIVIKK